MSETPETHAEIGKAGTFSNFMQGEDENKIRILIGDGAGSGNDIIGDFDTVDAAKAWVQKERPDLQIIEVD